MKITKERFIRIIYLLSICFVILFTGQYIDWMIRVTNSPSSLAQDPPVFSISKVHYLECGTVPKEAIGLTVYRIGLTEVMCLRTSPNIVLFVDVIFLIILIMSIISVRRIGHGNRSP